MLSTGSRLLNFSSSCDPLDRWGLRQIHMRKLEAKAWTSIQATRMGDGVDVYLVDSGINEKHLEFIHPQYPEQRVHLLYDAFGGQGIDELGHGTYMASLIAGRNVGVAPLAHVWNVKVFAQNFETPVDNILQGLESVLTHHKSKKTGQLSVLNASWCVDLDQRVDQAIRLLIEAGIVVVAAAGTGNRSVQEISPAASAEVITVGATTRERNILLRCAESSSEKIRAAYSGDRLITNYGPGIDIFAPGEAVYGADSKSSTGYMQLSGSSVSTAYVSGVVACLREDSPKLNPIQLREHLMNVSTVNVLPQEVCEKYHFSNRFLFQPLQKTEPRWQVDGNSLLAIVEPGQSVDVALPCESATGDTLKYSLMGGRLPQGLVLHPNGRIIGMPLTPDAGAPLKADPEIFDFTIKATDANGESSQTFSIVFVPETHYSESDLQTIQRFGRVAKSPISGGSSPSGGSPSPPSPG